MIPALRVEQREVLREKVLKICADKAIPIEEIYETPVGLRLSFQADVEAKQARRAINRCASLKATALASDPAGFCVRFAVPPPLVQRREQLLNERELASVLAGLRLLQGEENGPIDGEAIDNIATNNGHLLALSDNEIDQLCERLNGETR